MDKRLLGSLTIAVVAAMGVASADKPPKLQDVQATTTFRCTAGDPSSASCEPVSDGTDRVRDDGNSYATGKVTTSGLYSLSIQSGSLRTIKLRLGASNRPIPCIAAGNCNPEHYLLFKDEDPIALDNVSIDVKPLTSTFQELDGLLWGMACSTDRIPAKVHYTFSLSGNGHWGFNFNHQIYPASNNGVVIRDSPLQWTVISDGLFGELLSSGHSGLLRPQTGPSHEGSYLASFKFTIIAAGPPAPGVGGC